MLLRYLEWKQAEAAPWNDFDSEEKMEEEANVKENLRPAVLGACVSREDHHDQQDHRFHHQTQLPAQWNEIYQIITYVINV